LPRSDTVALATSYRIATALEPNSSRLTSARRTRPHNPRPDLADDGTINVACGTHRMHATNQAMAKD
jgi:hypothetical protein